MKKYQAKHGTVKSNTSLFFSGVVILTAANLIVKIIGLLFKIPMANTFGDEVMGYYNSAYAIYTFFYMISTAGLPVAVSIMIAESRAKGKLKQIKRIFTVTVGLFFLIGLAGMAMMFFGSGWYSADVLKAEPTKYSIMVIAPMLFLICISSAIRGYFQGFQQMMPTAVSELIEAFCKLAVGIALAAYAADRYPGQYHIIAAYAAIGLTVGADDYVTKPFNPVELQARVRSQIRRYMMLGSGKTIDSKITIGGIELNDKTKQVTVDGEIVNLTRTEYDILKLLMEHPGEVYSPNQIYVKVWNDEPIGTENTVAVHIRHLREKIEIDPAEPRYLKVIWGRGYKMEGE